MRAHRLIFFICLSLTGQYIFGKQVPREDAQKAGLKFYSERANRLASPEHSPLYVSKSFVIGEEGRPVYYAFTINDKAYVTTGLSNGVNQTDLWMFDPATGAWTEKNKINATDSWTITRNYGTAFTLGSKAYVGLGNSTGVRQDFWEYDPSADTWTNKTAFEGSARQNAVSYIVNGKAYVATGRSGNYYFSDIWEFKPFDALNTDD